MLNLIKISIAPCHLYEIKIMLCKINQRKQQDTQQRKLCIIHHTFLMWKTLKEVKTRGPSPKIIHYQNLKRGTIYNNRQRFGSV